MSCMLCQKSGRIFNVYTNYGNANHNVTDDLIEIFGVDVESYLDPSDCVCNVCMNMLDNVAKLKRRLWPLICHANQDTKGIKLGKIWDIFASLKIEEEDNDDEHAIPCRTPTPNLLTFNYSRAYNHTLEKKLADIQRSRSLSRASSGTSEVANIFSKKGRKRKGHSRAVPRRSKTHSPQSDCSYASFYSLKKSPTKKKVVEYDEQGRLVRKRTRSVSRAQEKEAKCLEMLESTKFYCNERDCPLYFGDLDVLNQHRIKDHDMLALHFCDECEERYTTSECLKLHQKSHDTLPFLCPLCQLEVKNQETLQEHIGEHLVYSVPCKYCDKSFLSKKLCENHLKSAHDGNRERIVYRERLILDRLDKEKESRVSPNNNKKSGKSEYVAHFLPYTDMECSTEDLDVTTDNLKFMNVDTDDDVSLDESELLTESVSKRTKSSDEGLSPVDSVELNGST